MEIPQVDYNKSNLRWTHRIVQENRINGKQRPGEFESRKNSQAVQDKVNNLPPPQEQRERVLEYLRIKNMKGTSPEDCLLNVILSPREKFFFPQVWFPTLSVGCYLRWRRRKWVGQLVDNSPRKRQASEENRGRQ